jgi:hypothetical protein
MGVRDETLQRALLQSYRRRAANRTLAHQAATPDSDAMKLR